MQVISGEGWCGQKPRRTHIATVRRLSGEQVPISYGGNEKAPLKLRESANTNFLLARDNRVRRHRVHPGNYPGRAPFQERTERRKQPSSGEVTRALLLTCLLRRLAPTLVAAFRKAPTPDFRYLERRSYHSATVAVALMVQNRYQE